jgi:hypothetical protein
MRIAVRKSLSKTLYIILLPLISAFPSIVDAALLKDVRIGDHEAYTRVVFEFESDMAPKWSGEPIEGGLAITFHSVTAELMRKIPTHQSSRVENLTFWISKNSLTAKMKLFTFPFRYESIELSAPFRLVIDIFPISGAIDGALKSDPAADISIDSFNARSPAAPSTEQTSSGSNFSEESGPLGNRTEEISSLPTLKIDATPRQPSTPPTTEGYTDRSAKKTEPTTTESKTSRMQYYLVIGLVVITIVILSMLLLMLLYRYRWSHTSPQLGVDEILERQEERIASLNARIQEQIKRYHEI